MVEYRNNSTFPLWINAECAYGIQRERSPNRDRTVRNSRESEFPPDKCLMCIQRWFTVQECSVNSNLYHIVQIYWKL